MLVRNLKNTQVLQEKVGVGYSWVTLGLSREPGQGGLGHGFQRRGSFPYLGIFSTVRR